MKARGERMEKQPGKNGNGDEEKTSWVITKRTTRKWDRSNGF